MRVLVVEDELKMASLVRRGLAEEGHAADVAGTGEDAIWMAQAHPYDAIVLDVMLPGESGFETCRRLRNAGVWSPVLMLTARDGVEDRVAGLDAGADDYLPKPCSFAELLARLRSILRRSAGRASSVVAVGDLTIDERQMKVSVRGVPLNLSALEYRVIAYLIHERGRVVSQLELSENIHGSADGHDTNAIEVLIGRLRRKLGVDLIETRRGFGYLIPEQVG